MRDEIIGHCHEQAPKNIHRFGIAADFKVGFAKQAVGFEMFREGYKDVTAMSNRLICMPLFDERSISRL
jgi:hypothetical protein